VFPRYSWLMDVPSTLVASPAPLRADADQVIRIGSSRVTLDTLVGAFRDGCTAEGRAND
jgi:hypothetical protein